MRGNCKHNLTKNDKKKSGFKTKLKGGFMGCPTAERKPSWAPSPQNILYRKEDKFWGPRGECNLVQKILLYRKTLSKVRIPTWDEMELLLLLQSESKGSNFKINSSS